MTKYRYTEEQFRAAVSTSKSVRECLTTLGMSNQGGQYKTFYKMASKFNVDVTKLAGKSWAKGKHSGPKISTQAYLNNEIPIGSFRLKNRLIKEGILEIQCSSCKNVSWLDGPIPLELDHINGNSEDNSINNLRLLCPNCHALTDTYRGKNQRRRGGGP